MLPAGAEVVVVCGSRRDHFKMASGGGSWNGGRLCNLADYRTAIDLHENDEIDEEAFKTLIRAAAALNKSSAR